MGAYKSKPVTEKCSHYGANDFMTYAASSMQGWRTQQEDAHNCLPDFDTTRLISLFAVYDGHGGSEVARYCSSNLPNFLKELQAYKDSQPSKALEQLFLDFDSSLATPETRAALRSLMDKDSDSSDKEIKKSDEENSDDSETDEIGELKALQEEAEEPLESLLERYGGKTSLPKNIKTLLDARQASAEEEAVAGPSTNKTDNEPGSEVANVVPEATLTSGGKTSKDNDEVQEAVAVAASETKEETDVVEAKQTKSNGEKAEEEEEESSDESVTLEELMYGKQEKDNDNNEEEGEEEEDSESDEDEDSSEDAEDDDDDDDDDEEDEGIRKAMRFPIPIADQEEPGVDSGTTACVAVVIPTAGGSVRLFVANAGDSRAVLCRGGAAVDLSMDHKPEDEDEKARIIAAGGMVTRDGRVNGGLNLSRALGDHSYKQVEGLSLSEQMITPLPDISQYDLVPGADEFMVIACDGVWNSMTSQEVVTFVYDRLHPSTPLTGATEKAVGNGSKDSAKLKDICEELFDQCLAPNTDGDGTGCDNMTCIIVRFDDLPGLSRRLAEQGGGAESRSVDKKRVADLVDAAAAESPVVPAKRTRQDSQNTPGDAAPLIAVANGGSTV